MYLLLLDIPKSASLLLDELLLFLDDFELFSLEYDDEYEDVDDDESLSWLLFVLEILFTFLLLLPLPLPCLSLPSLSLSFDPDDELVRFVLLFVVTKFDWLFALWLLEVLLEYWFAWLLEDVDADFDVLLDFLCLDEDDEEVEEVVASGSRLDVRDETCGISGSFSGDDGPSLEFVSWVIGLYGGIGFTLPPFFCKP